MPPKCRALPEPARWLDFYGSIRRHVESLTTAEQSLPGAFDQLASDVPSLENGIAEIQARLGTPAERPDDLDRAAVVAHSIRNLLCIAWLLRDSREAAAARMVGHGI